MDKLDEPLVSELVRMLTTAPGPGADERARKTHQNEWVKPLVIRARRWTLTEHRYRWLLKHLRVVRGQVQLSRQTNDVSKVHTPIRNFQTPTAIAKLALAQRRYGYEGLVYVGPGRGSPEKQEALQRAVQAAQRDPPRHNDGSELSDYWLAVWAANRLRATNYPVSWQHALPYVLDAREQTAAVVTAATASADVGEPGQLVPTNQALHDPVTAATAATAAAAAAVAAECAAEWGVRTSWM